jgi:hypothetical protein
MTTATEPRQELVLLEPRDRGRLDLERAVLLAEIEKDVPIEIVSPLEYSAAAELERRLGVFIATTEPAFDEHCTAAHKVWKQACEIRALFLDAPKRLKAELRVRLSAYKEKQDRIRRDEERRLALEEQAREQKRLNAEAKLAEQQGQKALAKAIRATPVEAPAVVLPSVVPDVGLSFREDWCWEPVGGDTPANRLRALGLLVRADYLTLITFNDSGLTQFARRTKGTIKVPGIRFFSKQVPVRR